MRCTVMAGRRRVVVAVVSVAVLVSTSHTAGLAIAETETGHGINFVACSSRRGVTTKGKSEGASFFLYTTRHVRLVRRNLGTSQTRLMKKRLPRWLVQADDCLPHHADPCPFTHPSPIPGTVPALARTILTIPNIPIRLMSILSILDMHSLPYGNTLAGTPTPAVTVDIRRPPPLSLT